MSKNQDHLFDELIEALEALSAEAAPPPRPYRLRLVRQTRIVAHRLSRKARRAGGELRQASRVLIAPMSDIRMIVRMIILIVVAGAGTLLLVTRPFTSGEADARMPSSPSDVVAHSHTELERVTLRGTDKPAWSAPTVDLPPVEPLRSEVVDKPAAVPEITTRLVRTEHLRIAPGDINPENRPLDSGTQGEQAPAPVAAAPAPKPEPKPEPKQEPRPDARLAALPAPQPAGTTPAPSHQLQGATVAPDLEALYQRGLSLHGKLDIAAARLLLKRAADRGHAAAALAYAESHDDTVYDRNMYGIGMDINMARRYYAIARDLGAAKAAERLAALDADR